MFLLFNFQSFNADPLRLSFAPQSSSTAFPQSNHLLTPTRCAKASLELCSAKYKHRIPSIQSSFNADALRLSFAPQS